MTDHCSHSIKRILSRQREFSLRAFGPGRRTVGLCKQVVEELIEVLP